MHHIHIACTLRKQHVVATFYCILLSSVSSALHYSFHHPCEATNCFKLGWSEAYAKMAIGPALLLLLPPAMNRRLLAMT